MLPRSLVTLIVVATLALAGCVTAPDVDPAALADPEVPDLSVAFAWDHDHEDAALHDHEWNVETLGHVAPLPDGVDALSFGELDVDFDRNLAFAHVLGGEGGFAVFDVSDAADPVFLHFERTPDDAACVGDVKVGPYPDVIVLGTQCSRDASGSANRGFILYNVQDPTAPELMGGTPPGFSCHMVDTSLLGNVGHVYCAGSEGPSAWRLDWVNGDIVGVLVNPNVVKEPQAFLHAPHSFEEFGAYGPALFVLGAHDMTTQADPLTGDPIVIASNSYSGVRILDGKDPAVGTVLGTWTGDGAEQYSWIHTAQAIEMDGKRIVVAITENVVETPPRLWVLDFTDYANPVVLAEYALADQETSHGLAMTLHNFQLVQHEDRTRMYVAAYHAGVWALDLTDPTQPTPVGFVLPDKDPYEFPDASFWGIGTNWVGQVWDVVVKDGVVLASDMHSGIHAYRFDGAPLEDPTYASFG